MVPDLTAIILDHPGVVKVWVLTGAVYMKRHVFAFVSVYWSRCWWKWAKLPSSKHSMRCCHNSSWQKEILARSWLRAEWYMTAMLNKLQSVASSGCCSCHLQDTFPNSRLVYLHSVLFIAWYPSREWTVIKQPFPWWYKAVAIQWCLSGTSRVWTGTCAWVDVHHSMHRQCLTGMRGSFSRLRITSASISREIEFAGWSNPLRHRLTQGVRVRKRTDTELYGISSPVPNSCRLYIPSG